MKYLLLSALRYISSLAYGNCKSLEANVGLADELILRKNLGLVSLTLKKKLLTFKVRLMKIHNHADLAHNDLNYLFKSIRLIKSYFKLIL